MNRFSFVSSLSIASLLLVLSTSAFADTYQIEQLPEMNGDQVLGFSSPGDVVIAENAINEYLTVDVFTGTQTTSATSPILALVQGTCPGVPSGFNTSGTIACDNGYVGFASRYNTNGDPDGLYTGTLSDLTDLGSYTFDGGGIDSFGDLAFTDGASDENYVALDVTNVTPEPESLLLVATGLLATAAFMRLRTRQTAEA